MRRSSQDLWTEGEALERAGKGREAIDLFVRAASVEEDAHRPLRAKLLWEQISTRIGASGTVFEKLASACGRGHLNDEAFDYWVAAAARYHVEGRAEDATRARAHAAEFRKQFKRMDPERVPPALVAQAVEAGRAFVSDLLETPTP
jgi:hypothetical protein